jgi:hypothetical protein
MDKDKSVVAKFELVGETTVNLLKDGNFPSSSVISTNQDASWFLGQGTNWGGSAAKTSVAGGTATVDVTTIGTENYQPQLVQYNLALDKGMKYKLSFKASADVDRKIEVNFQQSVDPWGAYATKEFDITTTEQEYTFIFAMEEDSDDAAQFAINLGQATGTVKISDVKLVFTNGEPGSSGSVAPGSSASTVPGSSNSAVPGSAGSTTPGNNGTNNGAGNEAPEAIGNIHMSLSSMDMQVFDVQGRNLGRVRVNAGASLEETLFAKFHKSGIYLVKQGSRMMKVRVTRSSDTLS